jgi:hypothetical protein
MDLRTSLHEMIDEMEWNDLNFMVKKLKKYNFIVSDKDNNLVWVYVGRKKVKKMLENCVDI